MVKMVNLISLVIPNVHDMLSIPEMVLILDIYGKFDIPHILNISHIIEIPEKLMGRCQIATKRHRPVSNSQEKTPPGVK